RLRASRGRGERGEGSEPEPSPGSVSAAPFPEVLADEVPPAGGADSRTGCSPPLAAPPRSAGGSRHAALGAGFVHGRGRLGHLFSRWALALGGIAEVRQGSSDRRSLCHLERRGLHVGWQLGFGIMRQTGGGGEVSCRTPHVACSDS